MGLTQIVVAAFVMMWNVVAVVQGLRDAPTKDPIWELARVGASVGAIYFVGYAIGWW